MPAPGSERSTASARSTRSAAGRSQVQPSANTSRTASSAAGLAGSACGATGAPGTAPSRPTAPSAIANSATNRNGSVLATVHRSQTTIGSRLRSSAANASTAVTSTVSSRMPMNSETAQIGRILRLVRRSRLDASALIGRAAGAASSTVTARSAARPNVSSRWREIGASAGGGRSPPIDSRTAGSPRASSAPCSPNVAGIAKRANWLSARGAPEPEPVSTRTASWTVARRRCGVAPSALDQPVTSGALTLRDARSPSTSTPPIGPLSSLARSAAPAAPPLPPLVETSVSVRRVWRGAPKMRASSSSAAVPDSSASARLPAASRCATTTIRSSIVPGRCAMTVRSDRRPSIVSPSRVTVRTRKPASRISEEIVAASR